MTLKLISKLLQLIRRERLLTLGLSSYFLLLLWNITNWDLFVGDEQVYVSSIQSILSGELDANPHPLLAKTIWSALVYLLSVITASYSPLFWRLGTVILSIASLIVFYRIARLFFTQKVAWLSVFLLALDPMFFTFSRLLQLEVPLLFFLLLSLYGLLLFLKQNQAKPFYLAGLFLGLALAVKLSPILLILGYLFLLFVYGRKIQPNKVRVGVIFLLLVLFGFLLGNGLFFLIKNSLEVSLFGYIDYLFHAQLFTTLGETGYLTSPAWSWFTIPQILTLLRVPYSSNVETFVVFQNPVLLLFTWGSLIMAVKSAFEKPQDQKLIGALLISFLALLLPWFFNLHATYYYYILILEPLVILLVLSFINKLHLRRTIFLGIVLATVLVFALAYPLLTGIRVPQNYEKALKQYSLYDFPTKNDLFCQDCSP